MGWRRNTRTGHRSRDLGHGLFLDVIPEAREFAVVALGHRLETNSKSLDEAKRRAEDTARRWMNEALLKLSMGE